MGVIARGHSPRSNPAGSARYRRDCFGARRLAMTRSPYRLTALPPSPLQHLPRPRRQPQDPLARVFGEAEVLCPVGAGEIERAGLDPELVPEGNRAIGVGADLEVLHVGPAVGTGVTVDAGPVGAGES